MSFAFQGTGFAFQRTGFAFQQNIGGSTGAGRSRRRRLRYRIRIEGRIFEAETEAQAISILHQAEQLAEIAAKGRADEIVEKALPKAIALGQVKPISIKAPTVDVSEELEAAAEQTRKAIAQAYAKASAIAELRLLLALMEEDDEEAFLLLH